MIKLVPLWEEEIPKFSPPMGGHSEKTAVCKPGRELLPELDHADTLISDCQPPEL